MHILRHIRRAECGLFKLARLAYAAIKYLALYRASMVPFTLQVRTGTAVTNSLHMRHQIARTVLKAYLAAAAPE